MTSVYSGSTSAAFCFSECYQTSSFLNLQRLPELIKRGADAQCILAVADEKTTPWSFYSNL